MNTGLRVVVTGREKSGKTRLMERYAQECRQQDIPHLLLNGRIPATEEVLARLAAVCEYDRCKIENSVLLIDDIDALTDDPKSPTGQLFYGLFPFFDGLLQKFGKFDDMACLGRVDIIATATERLYGQGMNGSGQRRVVLPGIVATMQMVDISVVGVPTPERIER